MFLLKVSYSTGWVFGPLQDLFCFTLPFFIAFSFDGSDYINQSWLGFFFTKVFFAGHIFTTIIPLKKTIESSGVSKARFFIIPILYIAIYGVLIIYDFRYFQNFLCFSILVHIFYQHISWGKISFKREDKLSHSFLKILVILPLSLWLLNQLPSNPHYLYSFNLTENIPKLDWRRESTAVSIFFFITAFFLSITKENKKNVLNIGKAHFLLSTVLWLTYGLFYAKTVSFFLYYLNIAHGLGYMIYITQSWPVHHHLPQWNESNRMLKVVMTSLLGGAAWMTILWNSSKYLPQQFLIIPWLPLIIHFAFDSYLWSKSRLKVIIT